MAQQIVLKGRGRKTVTMRKGALHRALGVPEDQPIPETKKHAALTGAYGPKVKKMAVAAFKGILAAGRRTAAARRTARRPRWDDNLK